jgi:hypothetical protein
MSTSNAIEVVRLTRVSIGERFQSVSIPSSRNRAAMRSARWVLSFARNRNSLKVSPLSASRLTRSSSQELDSVL